MFDLFVCDGWAWILSVCLRANRKICRKIEKNNILLRLIFTMIWKQKPIACQLKNANFFSPRLFRFVLLLFFFVIRWTKNTQLNTCFQFTQISVQNRFCYRVVIVVLLVNKIDRNRLCTHQFTMHQFFFRFLECWIKWKFIYTMRRWEQSSEGEWERDKDTQTNSNNKSKHDKIESRTIVFVHFVGCCVYFFVLETTSDFQTGLVLATCIQCTQTHTRSCYYICCLMCSMRIIS